MTDRYESIRKSQSVARAFADNITDDGRDRCVRVASLRELPVVLAGRSIVHFLIAD
nr:hypothetical protein [Rhodopirellula sp. SM50]